MNQRISICYGILENESPPRKMERYIAVALSSRGEMEEMLEKYSFKGRLNIRILKTWEVEVYSPNLDYYCDRLEHLAELLNAGKIKKDELSGKLESDVKVLHLIKKLSSNG